MPYQAALGGRGGGAGGGGTLAALLAHLHWFVCNSIVGLQEAQPGDIDLEDALQILADKLKAQDKRASKARAVKRQAVAPSDTGVSSGGDVATSDDEVQPSSSSSSSKALDAAGETDAAGGGIVKERTKRKYVKAKLSSKVSANGTAASVGTAGTSDVKDRGKGKLVGKVQGQGKPDAAAAPVPKKGYRAFWSQMWAKLKIDDPGIKMTDANKQIASVWKHMDAESKEQYN